MERQVWLAERRAALVAVYDAEAATYGDGPQPWDVQRAWVARVLGLIPPGGTVLDAPCGTCKYFPMLAAAGHRVAGADQSAGMLARARARGIAFSLQRTSLQVLSYAGQFDAVLTIEADPGQLAALLRDRLGQADHNDLICVVISTTVPPSRQLAVPNGGS